MIGYDNAWPSLDGEIGFSEKNLFGVSLCLGVYHRKTRGAMVLPHYEDFVWREWWEV